jgi:hypothetical protein
MVELPDDIMEPVRTHFTELEDLIRDVDIERYNERASREGQHLS